MENNIDKLQSEDGSKPESDSGKPRSKFGDLKGFVTYISDDFDEPLDDFKEYTSE